VGYEELAPGESFLLDGSGQRVPLQYDDHEERPLLRPQSTAIQAFPKGGEHRGGWGVPGWGVRSTVAVNAGQAVLELCGCWLSDEQLSNTADRSWVITRTHNPNPIP